MPSRFSKFISSSAPVDGDISLTHSTDAFSFRDVMESGQLNTSQCTVFKGERLLYLFAGRAAYRANAGDPPNALLSYTPVCFILSSKIPLRIKRIYPFDSGGYSAGRFSGGLHHQMKISDFELEPRFDSVRRTITAFFGSVQSYMQNVPLPVVEMPKLAYEAESFHALITDKLRNSYDDRVSAIELQLEDHIELRGLVEAIILPDTLAEEPEVIVKLKEWNALPIPYSIIGRLKPTEYLGKIADLAKDYILRNAVR